MPQPSAAIIGAGIAGVSAARQLTNAGWDVVIFEKSRGWGGRCATKRWEGQTIDHGAQYFTIRTENFRIALSRWCSEGILRLDAPVVTPQGSVVQENPRFFHREGNSRIVRELGTGLAMQPNSLIERITDCTINDQRFDRIISTAPLPQTLALAGLPPVTSTYTPNLTLLLLYSGPVATSLQGIYAMADSEGPLAWSAIENQKPGRVEDGKTALVIQASDQFSRDHLEDQPSDWSDKLRRLAEERWGLNAETLLASHPHRWRFARVAGPTVIPTLPDGWIFAGDAMAESRLESAWHAGHEAALQVINL